MNKSRGASTRSRLVSGDVVALRAIGGTDAGMIALAVVVGCLTILTVAPPARAQLSGQPTSWTRDDLPALDTVRVLELPEVDVKALLEVHAPRAVPFGDPGPLRFAEPNDVQLGLDQHGTWHRLRTGGRLWRLRVSAPGATDLNFGFDQFRLPDGATLHVYSELEDYYEGPYTYRDNEEHGELWTPPVPGDRAVIELHVASEVKFEPKLRLARVSAGFRDFLGRQAGPKQGACNNDVICPEGDPWRNQIRAAAAYSLNGFDTCSGQLVNNTSGDLTPYFYTADHCGISSGNDQTMVVFWNFESANCGDLGGGSREDSQTGAIWRAARSDVDFALVELEEEPPPAYAVFYGGWDRTGTAPVGSVGIHHPSVDEKAISFNDDLLTTVNSCIGGGTNTHWEVDDWEDGTTEPGSSGSGLWNPDNKLLIGHLSGGLASCSVIDFDCYGKFSVAWDGPAADSRLKDWLDPGATGAMTLEGTDPAPALFYTAHGGADECFDPTANENGIWEPGEAIELFVSVTASGDFTGVTGTLSPMTPGNAVTVPTANWPDLTSGQSQVNLTPFGLQLNPTAQCFSEVHLGLTLTTNEGGPFEAVFANVLGAPLTPEANVPIPDNGGPGNPAESELIVVSDVTLTDVDVDVDIAHTWVGDLIIDLMSPLGTTVTLLDRPGVPGISSVGCHNDDVAVLFDDAAGFDPENECTGVSTDPWFSGSANPVDPLAGLNGESTQGTWTLIVSDNVGVDVGEIVTWELITAPAISGVCTPCAASCAHTDVLTVENQTISTSQQFDACVSIVSGNGLVVAFGGDVTFRAGESVVLQDGFSIKKGGAAGTAFNVVIDAALSGP